MALYCFSVRCFCRQCHRGRYFFRSLAGRSRSIPGPIYKLEAGGETAIRLKSSYHKTTLLGFNYAAILYDQHLHATVAPLRFYLRLKCLPCSICSNFEVLSHTDLCWPPQSVFVHWASTLAVQRAPQPTSAMLQGEILETFDFHSFCSVFSRLWGAMALPTQGRAGCVPQPPKGVAPRPGLQAGPRAWRLLPGPLHRQRHNPVCLALGCSAAGLWPRQQGRSYRK